MEDRVSGPVPLRRRNSLGVQEPGGTGAAGVPEASPPGEAG